jgi:hypothetical protein
MPDIMSKEYKNSKKNKKINQNSYETGNYTDESRIKINELICWKCDKLFDRLNVVYDSKCNYSLLCDNCKTIKIKNNYKLFSKHPVQAVSTY